MNGISTMRLLALCAAAIIFALARPSDVNAQQETAVWHFGYGVALDFNIPPATPAGPVQVATQVNASEGSAVVSDRVTGRTLFYTDGISVWDSTHAVMANTGS